MLIARAPDSESEDMNLPRASVLYSIYTKGQGLKNISSFQTRSLAFFRDTYKAL